MLANLPLPLLLVASGQSLRWPIGPIGPGGIGPSWTWQNMTTDTAQQGPDNLPGSPGMAARQHWPPWIGPGKSMAVDTAGTCNCACARTAEVTMPYQTKYNACVGRADRHRLCSAPS